MSSCSNCKIPCTGCAGARHVNASDGKPCCTKCLGRYELSIRSQVPPIAPTQQTIQDAVSSGLPPNLNPVINSIQMILRKI